MGKKIGIDLGYANITLSNAIADIYREPSVVLVDKNTRKLLEELKIMDSKKMTDKKNLY